MKEALERTIQTLIDSGGDPWEYDSNDIQTLVKWIENQQKQVKNIAYEPVLAARTWTPEEIIEELKDIDAFDAAKYFFDKYGS
jgi:hypothetical protein